MRVYPQLEGHFTIVAIHHDQADLARGCPPSDAARRRALGEGENFLASNVAAFLSENASRGVP